MNMSPEERLEVFRIAENNALADGKAPGGKEKKILRSLKQVLQ